MRNLRRKFIVAALTASAAIGGLALPQTASADSVQARPLQICNDTNQDIKFFLVGFNDHDDRVNSRFWTVPANKGCVTAEAGVGDQYWWKTNSSVEFHYHQDGRWNFRQLYVQKGSGMQTSWWLGNRWA